MNRDELRKKIAHIIGYYCFPSVGDAHNQRWYYEIADKILSLIAPVLADAEKWDKVKEIALKDPWRIIAVSDLIDALEGKEG